MNKSPLFYLIALLFITACNNNTTNEAINNDELTSEADSTLQLTEEPVKPKILTHSDIILEKDIQYEEYLLEDEYPFEDTIRIFQWDKIKDRIAHIENEINNKDKTVSIAIFSNYRNMNGEAPTVADFVRNPYGRVSDQYDVERYQSVPLYSFSGDTTLVRYGRDGWIAEIIGSDTVDMVQVRGISFDGDFLIPNKYLKSWGDTILLDKVVAVDVTNQNISTLEKRGDNWHILSMNPATTGVHNPPYAHETPIGIFAVQEQKDKMFYTKDGSNEIAGYAPYASRFTNGAYIHGVPTQNPRQSIIEWSPTLGTTPRSHMCVRNASSHSKFVFDWLSVKEAVVVVID